MRLKKLFTLTAPLLVAGIGLSGNAQASAYALSYDHITNGIIDIWQQDPGGAAGDACSLLNSGIGGVSNCPVGTTVLNSAAAPGNTSGASATLNGSGPATSDSGTGLRDTIMAATGTAVGTAEK